MSLTCICTAANPSSCQSGVQDALRAGGVPAGPARSPWLERSSRGFPRGGTGTRGHPRQRQRRGLLPVQLPQRYKGSSRPQAGAACWVHRRVRGTAPSPQVPETALSPFPLTKQTSEKEIALHFTGTQWQSVLNLLKWPHLSKSIPVCKIRIQNTTFKQIIYIQGSCNIKQ